MTESDLTQRPTSGEHLERWYAAALSEQESSGLSVADFAEHLGVTATTLYHWRRRLARRAWDCGADSPSPKGLVHVTVDSRAGTGSAGPLVVRLRADRSIEVPAEFDGDELRRLVTVLESC